MAAIAGMCPFLSKVEKGSELAVGELASAKLTTVECQGTKCALFVTTSRDDKGNTNGLCAITFAAVQINNIAGGIDKLSEKKD